MDDELVDIVDESDRVLMQAAKSSAHAEELLHCCAIGMLVNSRGQWTLVRQSADRQDAGQLVSPVGGMLIPGGAVVALYELGVDFVSLWPVAITFGAIFAFYPHLFSL